MIFWFESFFFFWDHWLVLFWKVDKTLIYPILHGVLTHNFFLFSRKKVLDGYKALQL